MVAVIGFALRNLIASGLALSPEPPYRIGDCIEAGSGVVGQVVEIDWRATRLLTRQCVGRHPERIDRGGKLVNYSHGDGRYRAKLEVMLDASIPVERAKRVLLTGAIATPLCDAAAQAVPARSSAIQEWCSNWQLEGIRIGAVS